MSESNPQSVWYKARWRSPEGIVRLKLAQNNRRAVIRSLKAQGWRIVKAQPTLLGTVVWITDEL